MQATKQMVESGELFSIRFQQEPRTKKPVGIHWLQTAVIEVFGGDTANVQLYRLPSAVSVWLAVLCVFVVGRFLWSSQTGLVAAGLLACTLIAVTEAHLAKTDAALLLAVVLAQAGLLRVYLAPDAPTHALSAVLLFWCAIGFGLLIKGPVIVAVVSATIAALCIADRRADWLSSLQPAIGIPVALAFLVPWLAGSAALDGGNVVLESLREDFLPKLLSGQEGHGAPPGSHTVAALLTLWPSSLLILPGLILAWRHRQDRTVRFALAWGLAPWIVFELVPTKLPHYVLPMVPGLALAAATGLSRSSFDAPWWSRILWGLSSAVLALALGWTAWTYGGSKVVAGAISGVLLVVTALSWTPQRHLQFLVPVLAIFVFGLTFSRLLPSLEGFALSARLASIVEHHGGGPVALSRYHEPSAVFLLGTETWLTNSRNAAAHIAADPNALAAVAEDEIETVQTMLEAQSLSLVTVDRLVGYNYSKGRTERIVVIRSQEKTDTPL